MPSGKLGAATLAAAADTELCTVAAGKVATVTVSICNRSANAAKLRIAVGTGAGPANGDYLEYDTPVPASGVLERSGIAMSAGEKVFVRSDIVGVDARVHGFEEAA